MFVIPKAWTTHATLLQQVLLEDIQPNPHKPTSFPNVGTVLETHYNMIQARVRVFTHLNSTGTEPKTKSSRIGGNVEVFILWSKSFYKHIDDLLFLVEDILLMLFLNFLFLCNRYWMELARSRIWMRWHTNISRIIRTRTLDRHYRHRHQSLSFHPGPCHHLHQQREHLRLLRSIIRIWHGRLESTRYANGLLPTPAMATTESS